jgi:hypothetical protein
LDTFKISASEIPVLICRGQVVLRNPTNQQIADCLGFNDSVDQTKVRDLVVIGGGPSGLAGVFAVGDVRGGSIKRVASAVGEGSTAISIIHKVLQE